MKQAAQILASVVRGFGHVTRLSLFRNLRVPYPWLRISGNARFRTDEVWPQPSPISPNLPYAVLHLPAAEVREFVLRIVSRFKRQVAFMAKRLQDMGFKIYATKGTAKVQKHAWPAYTYRRDLQL